MEKLIQFQNLIEEQKEKKVFLETILEQYLKKTENHKINFEMDFRKDNLIYLKFKEKSSIKFYLLQFKDKIIQEFNQKYPDYILKLI